MGCFVSSRKKASITSVAPAPDEGEERLKAAQARVEAFLIQDVGEDDEVAQDKSLPCQGVLGGVLSPGQFATRKAENKKRTGMSSVAKTGYVSALPPAQIGVMTGIDFSMQCDFPAIPGQVSPRFSRPALPREELGRQATGTTRNGYSYFRLKPFQTDDPDESIDCLPPSFEREPLAPLVRNKQQPPWSSISDSNQADKDSSTETETPQTLNTADDGGGDHAEKTSSVLRDAMFPKSDEVKKNQQRQGDGPLLSPKVQHLREETMLQLLTSNDSCPGLYTGDHSICHVQNKPLTYSGICRATIAKEFRFSVEDILQRELPCNSPEVMEVAAMTGMEGGALSGGGKFPIPSAKDYLASWDTSGGLLNRETGDSDTARTRQQSSNKPE